MFVKNILKKSKKEEIIKGLEKTAKEAKSVVFVNFHGLNVTGETALRGQLRSQGVGYQVARKTLLRKAFTGKAEGEIPELPGEVAIAYLSALPTGQAGDKAGSEDSTAPAREVFNFGKAHQGVLKILGGIFAGKFADSAFMMEIATIPSREVLLSKIAFLLKSPMQRLAIAVNEVAKKK